jgi:hypothetical protein
MKIFYTGIGCNKTGEHTEIEFLNIMNKEFTHKSWRHELATIPRENHYQLQFKDWFLPDDFVFFTLTDWIEYSGAEICVSLRSKC